MGSDCVFCKMVRGEIPVKKQFENEKVMAFADISPMAPLHLLFIPKHHIESLAHMKDPSVMADLYAAIQDVARQNGLQERGFRTVINTGPDGGQTVFHLHVHMLSGKKMGHSFT